MKWGLQHVKVTLEDVESGEVVVIEQRPDGTLVCKERGEGRPKEVERKIEPRAAEPANARPTKAESTKSEAKPKTEAKEARAPKPAEKKDEGKESRPRKPRSAKPRGERKTLEWKATKDDIYDGYEARSRGGVFKALRAHTTQWALFYERPKSKPYAISCFIRLEQAQARAQELHRVGWPESEFGKVTAEDVERACPLPEREGEAKASAPTNDSAPPASDAAADKELLGSFGGVLGQVLDEED